MPTITVTALSHAGEGIGRLDGQAIFVPYALPGETVEIEILEQRKRFARARLVNVLSADPARLVPHCPHHFQLPPSTGFASDRLATACGGCQLQHLTYAGQIAFKQRTVADQMRRVGGIANASVRPPVASPAEYYYRNHVQFSVTLEGRLGFRSADARHVIPIRECRQVEPVLAELFPHIEIEPEQAAALERVTLRAGIEDETLVVFEAGGDPPQVELDVAVNVAFLRPDGTAFALAGRDYVVIEVKGRPFKASAGSFFQVNTPMVGVLVDIVLEALDLKGGESVLDLYCGVGLFTAFIAPVAVRVVGVEEFPPAVADAAVNLDEFENVDIYEAPVEAALPALSGPFDAAVLDPPRAGCEPAGLKALAALGPARIVYVSCDPATLARDVKRLTAHGYELAWVQPLDMFPQTFHIECVALLVRSAP